MSPLPIRFPSDVERLRRSVEADRSLSFLQRIQALDGSWNAVDQFASTAQELPARDRLRRLREEEGHRCIREFIQRQLFNQAANPGRPSTAPARSDTVLVSSASYDITGMVATTTDPAELIVCAAYDHAARTIQIIENCTAMGGSSSPSFPMCDASDDTNRTIQYSYAPDGGLATMTAVNASTGDQTTAYTYGTTLTESAITTSNLLRFVDYPDSTGGSDRVAYAYNRQQERTGMTDQRGCIHAYVMDALARLIHDRVTTLGAGVDGAVRRLSTTYDVRGLVSHLTSYDNATVGSGSVVNDVALTYNSFGQIIADAQSHSGATSGSTPKVQYDYADGSTNTIRPTKLTYPNGRAITTSYGTSGGINDSASRVDALIDDDATTLVDYSYLGMNLAVQVTYPQPGIQYTLLGDGGGNDPITGDIYKGLDLFARIKDSRWFNTSTNADVDRVKYGYDRASNRIWRQNPVATAAGAQFDEFYNNDGLQRLKDMQRGTLNGTKTGITSPTAAQCWTLDITSNWNGFKDSTDGSTWTTNESRTANAVNEITSISTGAGVGYDPAGNMTMIPQIGVTPTGPSYAYWETLTVGDWANMTLDQWSGLLVMPELSATYDAWNRQTKLVDVASTQTIQENQYDARTFRTVIKSYTSGVLAETRHSYFSTSWRCLEERVSTSTSPDRQFVWGTRYIDDLIVRDQTDERLYALQDANWNVTSIVNTSSGVQERYAYSAYGVANYLTSLFAARLASSYGWEVQFCGYRFDVVSAMLAVRFRILVPRVGNWCQRDPAGYSGNRLREVSYSSALGFGRPSFERAGMTLYGYCNSRPIHFADPYGLAEGWWNQLSEAASGVWNLGPFDALDAAADPKLWGHTTAGDARQNAKKLGKNERQINALRHCMWQALLTFQNGATTAEQVGNAHEWGAKDKADSNTDQFNNVIGRRVGDESAASLRYNANKAWFNCTKTQYTEA